MEVHVSPQLIKVIYGLGVLDKTSHPVNRVVSESVRSSRDAVMDITSPLRDATSAT